MPRFSKRSQSHLTSSDKRLQEIFEEVVKHFDCTILEGARGKDKQEYLYHRGQSKLRWPESLHNQDPSLAVDAAPYPIDWDDKESFYYFAGFVKGIAAAKGIKLRWGGDWDSDNDLHDQTFMDLVHFELVTEPVELDYEASEPTDEEVEVCYDLRHLTED